ncbi:MAG: hypothetical protein HDR03_14270 [Lachnospiraceae bacterium]|nr:hypothetical protein [Lachnospiraceae bacterium]
MHVLMYAPTYRFSKEEGKSVHQSREIEFGYQQIKEALEKRFGGNWLIALRLHPSVRDAVKEIELPDFVFDVIAHEYELLINYRELPFDIAEDTEQLCTNILNFDRNKYEKQLNEFLDKYGIKEGGHASE